MYRKREREEEEERDDSSLWRAISIEAALSPTANHCLRELKESVNQLSLVCVRLPFSEMWRREGKEEREQYSTYHRRKLGPECFCV